ncbi:gamma-glutamylcyclotransferase family protein [Mucilaginibacter endophyticus]|uniref:gamma-glutamylcyclotransferase family protein n=1 Tax=Mucilaginibacter endophyticus TaxID=2675003 RepID=UPI000E0D3E4D|nr:gamma-glutamylcyclotransferase family protein [Mucilaginibacter endophyticus]
MEITNRFLFVYGTLLQPGNEFADYLNKHCKFINKGKVNGRLYDIGEYPGAVIDNAEALFIHGAIFIMDEPQTILEVIDDYEGIGEAYDHPQEYTRELVKIQTVNGAENCWMYIYNLPVSTHRQIIGGDYMLYLNNAVK